MTVDGTSGPQTDPHVSQNMASYTDVPSGEISHYNFKNGTDNGISNVLATGENYERLSLGRVQHHRCFYAAIVEWIGH